VLCVILDDWDCLSLEKLIPRILLAGGWEIGMCNNIILEIVFDKS
jgi:hypothetical protein